jgi:hypothetical protein
MGYDLQVSLTSEKDMREELVILGQKNWRVKSEHWMNSECTMFILDLTCVTTWENV